MGGRFIFNSPLLELFGWALSTLEIYPKMFLFLVQYLRTKMCNYVKVWEVLVFNDLRFKQCLPQFYCVMVFIVLWQKRNIFENLQGG